MPEETLIHEACTMHDGQVRQQKLVLWLLGILITSNMGLGITLYSSMSEIKANISTVTYRFKTGEDVDARFEVRLNQLESRLREIELSVRK